MNWQDSSFPTDNMYDAIYAVNEMNCRQKTEFTTGKTQQNLMLNEQTSNLLAIQHINCIPNLTH